MAELKGATSQPSSEPEESKSKSKSFSKFLLRLRGRPKTEPADLTPKSEPPPRPSEPPKPSPEQKTPDISDASSVVEAPLSSELDIKSVRRTLGLSERSPLLDQEKIAKDRKEAVDLFCRERLDQILEVKDDGYAGGFIDRNLASIAKEEQEKQETGGKIKGPGRLSQWLAFKKMKRYGVMNPEEMLSVVQSESASYFDSPRWSEKAVASNLAEFDSQELKAACHRLRVLGYRILPYDFEDKTIIRTLKEMAQISEEKFQKACQELNPYFFVSGDSTLHGHTKKDLGKISPSLTTLMGVVKNGGLTPEQKQKLDQLQRFALLVRYDSIPTVGRDGKFRNRGGYYNESDNLAELLDNNLPEDISAQAKLITEDLVYHGLQKQAKGEEIDLGAITADAYSRIRSLKLNGYLPAVADLINKGINCDGFILTTDDGYTSQDKRRETLQDFDRMVKLAGDEEKLQWAALFAEAGGRGLNWGAAEIYEKMYQQKEVLVNFEIFLQVLPKELADQFKDLLKYGFDNSIDRAFNTSRLLESLADSIKSYLVPAELAAGEKEFLTELQYILSRWTSKKPLYLETQDERKTRKETAVRDLVFLSYLSQNKDRKNELLDYSGVPTAVALTEMFEGKMPVSADDLNYWVHQCWVAINAVDSQVLFKYLDLLTPDIIRHLIRSDRFTAQNVAGADSLSEGSKNFLGKLIAFKANEPLQTLIFEHRAELAQIFNPDGSISLSFIEKAQGKYIAFADCAGFVTEETIKQVLLEQQPYWRFMCFTAPKNLRNFAYALRERHAVVFKDSRPTQEFFEEGLKLTSFFNLDEAAKLLRDNPAILAAFPEGERKNFWQFFAKQDNPSIRQFIFNNGALSAGLLSSQGQPTELFFTKAIDAQVDSNALARLLTDQVISTFDEEQQKFWQFYKKISADARWFLYQNRNQNPLYVKSNGEIDEVSFQREFIRNTLTTPERIQTYGTLAAVFETLAWQPIASQDRGLIYLRISEAYQVNRLTQPVQVEEIVNLQRAFARLYRPDMTPFETQCWRILQKQLPFTADESIRVEMRDQAVKVESLDWPTQPGAVNRLSWVHQMIHNYASTKAPAYLQAFRHYLETGDQKKLLEIRETYQAADCRCPDLTDKDRQELQKALPEVDKLIDLSTRFYEVNPQRLTNAIADVLPVLSRYPGLESKLTELQHTAETVVNPSVSSELVDEAVSRFCLRVNSVRSTIIEAVTAADIDRQSRLLVLDSVLSGLSQQFFVRYTDRLQPLVESGKFSASDTYEASAVFQEMLAASFLEGENFDPDPDLNLRQKAAFFNRFKEPAKITPVELHSASLFIPLISARMNTLWGRFIQVAQPEMKEMLIRLGVSEKDAFNRVYMTDLVEYRKKSMSYVIEPMIPLVAQMLKVTEEYLTGNTARYYEAIIPPEITAYHQPEVDQVISSVTESKMPTDLNEASSYLRKIGNSSFARAEKLCRILFPEYLNRNDPNQRKAVEIKVGNDKIEISPFSHYGIDSVVLRLNGRIIGDPQAYLLERFRPPEAVKAFLKEGD